MATADSISISDRMSSSSSLYVPPRLKTTTISTIAVKCFESRMVIALLQSKDILNLRILEMKPSLTSLGKDVEESERLLNEHMKILEKLRNNQTPLEEYFRRTNNLTPNPTPELFTAMGDNLGQAWRDLLANLDLRKEILYLGIIFHGYRTECVQNFKNLNSDTGKDFMRKYSNALEAGRKLLEKLEIVEDSWESVARVNGWLEDLATKLQESRAAEKKRDEENRLNKIYELMRAELDDIITSPHFELKTQRLVGLLAKVNSDSSLLSPARKSELESAIYSVMQELALKNETLSQVKDFLNQNNQLHTQHFKEKYFEKLKIARNVDKELTTIIQNRLAIREDYEEIFQNVLGYSEAEIVQKLSRDKNLEVSDAFENIRLERLKQGTELFDLFNQEIQNLEAQATRNGDSERVLSDVANLIPQIENAPEFLNKKELIQRCTNLHEETWVKMQMFQNITQFVNNYRDLTEEHFIEEHNTILHELEKINRVETTMSRLIKNRISVRRSYEDILKNPTQFEEDEIIELLSRENSLDPTLAFKIIKDEKRLQELLQTLDFPLPENLETARNDLEDFKSFEQIIQSMPNTTEELLEKTIVKKSKIMKCIEFYELIESLERTKQIKHISRLEIELFGTTHFSESIYEEKINQIEKSRQKEIAEGQKLEKREISNIEVQTDDELFPSIQERLLTPPPLLVETDMQTNEMDPLEVRNSETQTTRISSKFSATQTNLEAIKRPVVIPASSMETQTVEIQPQIIYLYPEPAPIKLRNSQTQTDEEPATEMFQKRSQIMVEETFEKFESKQMRQRQENPVTSSVCTQTDKTAAKLPEEIPDEDTILVKTSDVASIAKLLLNTQSQTEREVTDPIPRKAPLDILIPTDIPIALAPPTQDPIFSKFLLTPAAGKVRPRDNAIEYCQHNHQDVDSAVRTISTTIDRRLDEEETNLELITPQMSVRDRVKAWQVTTPDGHPSGNDKIWQNNNKLKSQISRHLSLLEGRHKNNSAESIGNYRLRFQSPGDERKIDIPPQQLVPPGETKIDEYEKKCCVAEYRKMFQSFTESHTSDRHEVDVPIHTMIPISHIRYRKPEPQDHTTGDDILVENLNRVTEAAREKTLAMYRKLTNYNNVENNQQSHRPEQGKFNNAAPPTVTSQPSILTTEDKYPGFVRSEESLDGILFSSSSEISHPGFPKTIKYKTLPIRPSKFVPKEFQESDYESDYDCKILPIWVPPGGRSSYSIRGTAYQPTPSDFRSKSVPLSDVNGNERLAMNSKQAAISHLASTISSFKAQDPPEKSYSKPYQQDQNVLFKPIPPPKPSSPKASPAFQLSEETVTTKLEASLKSEVTERKETKFILAPPKALQEGLEDLTVHKTTPAYYISVTSPVIIAPAEEVATRTMSYESREERMEKYIEEFRMESTKNPSYNFDDNRVNGKCFPTITTFARQKELMHPILYELDDQNERIESEEVPIQIYEPQHSPRVIGRNRGGLDNFKSQDVVDFSDSTKSAEIIRFTPSKFVPMMTSEEEFSSAAEEDFIVEPKWKPLESKRKAESARYGSVKGPDGKKEKQKDLPVFYIACDFSCEYGLVENKK